MSVQESGGVVLGKVLPLEEHVRPPPLHLVHELVEVRLVLVRTDAGPAHAEVVAPVDPVRIVGSDVEGDGQGARRIDAAERGVEAELADRDPHAARTLVAQPEDPFAVGYDDDLDVPVHGCELLAHSGARVPGEEQPSGSAIDPTELLGGLPHRWCVDDGEGVGQVLPDEPVEQHLVAVLQGAQVDVLFQRVVEPVELVASSGELVLDRLDSRRQMTLDSEDPPLLERERRALVAQRIVQHVLTLVQWGGSVVVAHLMLLCLSQETPTPPKRIPASSAI